MGGWERMENYLNENFGDVKPKNSSEEALQRWRKLCWVVKNPKRRFRFTANLSKRFEAQAIRRSNQVISLFISWGTKVNSHPYECWFRLGLLLLSSSFDFSRWIGGRGSWNCQCLCAFVLFFKVKMLKYVTMVLLQFHFLINSSHSHFLSAFCYPF